MQNSPRTAEPTSRYAPSNAVKPIKLAEFIRSHAAVLCKVPGQGIEMIGNTPGSERVYIYTLPSSNASTSNIQLLFSIRALAKRARPIATLVLMENCERVKALNLTLASLDTSQNTLIKYLKRKEVSLAAYTELKSYIDTIKSVVDTVGNDMVWA